MCRIFDYWIQNYIHLDAPVLNLSVFDISIVGLAEPGYQWKHTKMILRN